MRPTPRQLLPIALAGIVLAGCGGSDTGSARDTTAASDESPSAAAEGASDAGDDGDQAVVVTPRQAQAVKRRLDAMVAAFAPVSARINFLVTAETLRSDAVDSNAGDDIELERTGLVRLELRRMRDVLDAARPNVASTNVSSEPEQVVRRRLLDAIDARRRAVGLLESALDGLAADVGDSIVEERFAAWSDAWGESVRATREATTAMQDERARVGLDPAPEESLR